MARETFTVHTDDLVVLDQLTDKQGSDLFRAMFEYHLTGEVKLSGLMLAVFAPFKLKFDREIAGRGSYLYIIRLQSPEESFIKIGIAYSAPKRFIDFGNAGYSVTEIYLKWFSSRSDALNAESDLHARYAAHQYTPLLNFGGYTECFSESVLEELVYE